MNEDKLHDECGVVGIFGAENAASLSYFALTSLQHRGQESAGIAVCDSKVTLHKDLGLVGEVFHPGVFEKLKGNIAVGHVRYATAGGRTIENAQPFLNTFKNGSIALAHNGQLVNHAQLRETLEDEGSTFSSSSDSEVILKLIVRKFIEKGGKLGSKKGDDNSELFISAVEAAVKEIKGSFALCIMTENMLIGVRDPNGVRPLCLGRIDCRVKPDNDKASCVIPDNANASCVIPGLDPGIPYILASESCAIDAVNGTFIRDVKPGEIIVIKKEGLQSILTNNSLEKPVTKQTCIFEYVYFARPDSIIDGSPLQNGTGAGSRVGSRSRCCNRSPGQWHWSSPGLFKSKRHTLRYRHHKKQIHWPHLYCPNPERKGKHGLCKAQCN